MAMLNTRNSSRMFWVAVWVWLLLVAPILFGQNRGNPPVRIMVVTGGHAYDTSFCSLFEGYDDFAPMMYPRDIAFRNDLRPRWDVLVLYDLSPAITEVEQENLRSFLESGKGLVVVHHAIANYNHWRWWHEEVVGGRYLLKPDGTAPASTYHPNQEVLYHPADHPITAGLGPLLLTDETYKGMWISPMSKPLLRTDHHMSDTVAAWVSPYQKSRVVVIQPGHDRRSHTHPGYRMLVRNAILWAAGRKR